MLFDFDHRDKMVAQTIEAQSEIENGDRIDVVIPSNEAKKINLRPGDEVLALATNGEQSLLVTQKPVTHDEGYVWDIDQELVEQLDPTESGHITIWITVPAKLDEIKIQNDLMFGEHLITGDENDPTGGTQLYIRTRDLRYTENRGVRGQVKIPAKFRNWLSIDSDSVVRITVHTTQTDDPQTITVDRGLISGGKKITIPKQSREDLNITQGNKMVEVWMHTRSITVDDHPMNLDTESTESESDTKEQADSNSDSDPDPVSDPSNVDEDVPTNQKTNVYDHASDDGDETEDGSTGSMSESETRAELELKSKEEKTPAGDADSDSLQDKIPVEEISVTAEVNPDLTPVVLLDDDERIQEQWTGHYQTDSGELLCGKDFVESVPDPERKHYDKVCLECAAQRPGALTKEDLSGLLEDYTDISFKDELPLILDREDSARLLLILMQNDGISV